MEPKQKTRPTALFLIGEPATGKTRIVRELMGADQGKKFKHGKIKGHALNSGGLIVVGDYTNSVAVFAGTDRLSMSAITDWTPFLKTVKTHFNSPPILLEGARLMNNRAIDELKSNGWEVVVAKVITSEDTIKRRRMARGGEQKEQWLKGNKTAVNTIAATHRAETIENIEGSEGLASAVAEVKAILKGART